MVAPQQDLLERLIRDCGQGWIIDFFGDPARALAALEKLLGETTVAYRRRYPHPSPVPSVESLAEEHDRNPHRVKAFLQALSASPSPEMLVMVWRILQGDVINQLRVDYLAEQIFSLELQLAGDDGSIQSFASSNIDDAALLRHLGIMKMAGRPLFDGFYPMQHSSRD
jgi:hypothetical protein